MPLAIPMATKKVVEDVSDLLEPEEARDFILKRFANFEGVRLLFNTVLIAVYIQHKKRGGNIIRLDAENDIWESKTGLVVKLGPDAYKDDPDAGRLFNGQGVKVGDWVAFRGNESIVQMDVRNYPCRLIEDANIRIIVDDPRTVF